MSGCFGQFEMMWHIGCYKLFFIIVCNQEGTHHVLTPSAAMDEREEEEGEEDLARMPRRRWRGEGRGRPQRSYHCANNRELAQNEVDEVRQSKNMTEE